MEKRISSRIQHKIDTYSNWDKAVGKFKPLSGELVIFTPDDENDVRPIKFKVGNGNKFIDELDFITLGLSGSGDDNINMNTTQSDWAQTDTQAADYIKNKPGDEIEEEEIINFVENYQLQEGQEVAPSVFTFGTISGEMTPQIGEKVRMFVKTSDNENIFIGEETLYHDAILQEMMGGTNDGPWACCTINSTVKNAAEAIQTGNLPIANETIPYAFVIVIVPDGRGGGYISIASTENLAGLNITLQKIEINLTTIKLANNALNIDLEPIENSNSLITSGGVYEALDSIKSLPVIQEIEGTTVLDTCITEGDYIYISPNGVRHKLIVSSYTIDDTDGEGNPGTVINQTLILTIDIYGDGDTGIYYRNGSYYMGEYDWEDFEKVMTSHELEDIIPNASRGGQVLVSSISGSNEAHWETVKFLPQYTNSSDKLKLVAKDNTEYWEEEIQHISDYDNTTSNLDACITEGEYIYYNNGYNVECKLIVKNNDIEGIRTSIIQVLICTTLISFEDAVDPFKVGIQWRTGELNMDGGIVWEDFNYVLTDKELYTLIPEHNENGLVLTTNSLSNRDYKWDKPKYVPTPKTEDVGKILTAIGTDPYEGFKWEELDKTMELPVIHDTVGISELDNAIISGVYKYIADNGLECILFISERIKNEQKNITQLLIKTTSNNDLSNDDLGRGLIGRGAFIRTGIAINDEVLWENDGKFSNIHDLPQAPSAIGYYVLNSDKNENNESLYTWTELSEGPMEGILNQVSTWLGGQLENVAYTNSINTFNNNQTINGNLTVNGNIIQEGDNYITHAEHVYTEDDYIVLRNNAQTPLSSYAGFEIQNYDGNNTTGHLVFDNQGTARVGDIGEEEPLTTRAEANEIVEGTLATWGLKNGAPVLTSGLSIMILTQNEYDSIIKDNNTLYLIKEE